MNRFLILILLIVSAGLEEGLAQQTDFEEFPQIDADYSHLALELEVLDGPRMRGEALYELSLMREHVDTLRLDAVRMDIDLVEWENGEVDYHVENDQLIIVLPPDLQPEIPYNLRIRYQADPVFGVLKDHNGTIWSSGKPASVRHWLPSADHPRNSFTTDISMIVPVEKEVVFSGVPGEESIESVDLKRIRFFTESEVPVSALRFAVGDFESNRTTAGRHQIYLHTERGLLNDDEKLGLMEEAYSMFRQAEQILDRSYPSRILHLIVLEDDKWESKNYGAGVVFGYKSLGGLTAQISEGVAAQWLGVQLRESHWNSSESILLLQTWLHEMSADSTGFDPDSLESQIPFDGIYKSYSRVNRVNWRRFMQSEDSEVFRNILQRTASVLMDDLSAVINWYDFSSYLYTHSGLNLMNPPRLSPAEPEQVEPEPVYRVIYHYDETENQLRLEFQSVDQIIDELVTVRIEEYTFNDVQTHEITFTGENEEVVLTVDPGIENLTTTVTDDSGIRLSEEKPFMFWIYQLRNDENPERRADAAVNLRNFADNPDLQLALLDIIDSEEDSAVYAEAIRTLSAVTDGASGTDQLFIQRFNSGAEPEIQIAIVEAFGNYQNSDNVVSRLRNVVVNSGSVEVIETALNSLSAITSSSRFRSVSENILSTEEGERVAPLILRELAGSGQEEEAVILASGFLDDSHPYQHRADVLDLLLEYDQSDERWDNRIELYSPDNDPRMRYRILDGLQFLSSDRSSDIVGDRLYEEYDDRVIQRLEELNSTFISSSL